MSGYEAESFEYNAKPLGRGLRRGDNGLIIFDVCACSRKRNTCGAVLPVLSNFLRAWCATLRKKTSLDTLLKTTEQ
jgi:hypothetical protein